MPEDHHLASTAGQLPLAELHDEVLLTLGSGHRLSQIVVGLAEKAQARVSDEYEGTSMDAVRLMAASGAGIAILPSIYAATEARRGTDIALRRLSDPQAARDIALVRSHAWAEESAVLVDILISEAKRILAGR